MRFSWEGGSTRRTLQRHRARKEERAKRLGEVDMEVRIAELEGENRELRRLVRDMYRNLGCPDAPCARCRDYVMLGNLNKCDMRERVAELGIEVE